MKAFTMQSMHSADKRAYSERSGTVGPVGAKLFLVWDNAIFPPGGGGIWPPRQIPVYCRPNPCINYMNFQMLYDKWWKLEEKYVFFIIMNLKGIVDVHQVILNMYCRLPCTIHDGTGLVMDEWDIAVFLANSGFFSLVKVILADLSNWDNLENG